jgi:dephospho-CoA kinase
MHKPFQIGITGGIGSGKSLICQIFHVLGVPVYDADSRAKKLMTTDGILIDQIKKEFGSLSYDEQGVLNREWLAKTVFTQPDKLTKLNSLVHPRVAWDYGQWIQEQAGAKYILKEAALLFEAGSYQLLDRIIVVTAPDELRIKRVLQRDAHRNKADVERIIKNQMPQEEKIKRADFIINNDESELMIPTVLKLHERFNSMEK